MFDFLKRDKVKTKWGGTVVSIREGEAKTRVGLETPKGSQYLYVTKCTVKLRQTVGPNGTVGYSKL